jgi:hypothetical protein
MVEIYPHSLEGGKLGIAPAVKPKSIFETLMAWFSVGDAPTFRERMAVIEAFATDKAAFEKTYAKDFERIMKQPFAKVEGGIELFAMEVLRREDEQAAKMAKEQLLNVAIPEFATLDPAKEPNKVWFFHSRFLIKLEACGHERLKEFVIMAGPKIACNVCGKWSDRNETLRRGGYEIIRPGLRERVRKKLVKKK